MTVLETIKSFDIFNLGLPTEEVIKAYIILKIQPLLLGDTAW